MPKVRGHIEPVAREFDGRLHQGVPLQPTMTLVRFPKAGDRARHADGAMTGQAEAVDHLAVLVEVHVARGGGGRDLAIVEERGLAVHVREHEAAAAQIAGFRVRDGQRERARDGGIDGIAAGLEDAGGGFGAIAVRHRDGGLRGRLTRSLRRRLRGGLACAAAPQHDRRCDD